MWKAEKNRYINKQYDIEVIFDPVFKKWEIHFPINEKMIRKIKYYDTFEEVSKIIQKEFGNEVYEKVIEQWFIDELGSRLASSLI